MGQKIRTFIAVKIDAEPTLIKTLAKFKDKLENEAVKWVEPNNLHLTLKFLGDIQKNQIQKIIAVLAELSSEFESFQFKLYGLGFFKTKGHPKILYTGIQEFDKLKYLANQLESRLQQLGFEKENREFKPHLTLARIKFLINKNNFYSCVNQFATTEFQTVNISEIIFYQSILKPEGPVYVPLQIFPFN